MCCFKETGDCSFLCNYFGEGDWRNRIIINSNDTSKYAKMQQPLMSFFSWGTEQKRKRMSSLLRVKPGCSVRFHRKQDLEVICIKIKITLFPGGRVRSSVRLRVTHRNEDQVQKWNLEKKEGVLFKHVQK